MSEENQLALVEQPQQLITIEPAKYVELVFEPFAKRLADAKTLAAAAEFDVTTTAGMAIAVKHRATFREIRVASEKARKERKAPILEIGKLLDSRQKEIEAEIEPFESRFDAAIKVEEARKEAEKQAKLAAEKARVDGIKARIEAFMLDAVAASSGSAADIDAYATKLSETVISIEEFNEFAGEAQVKRNDTVKWLRERQQDAANREAEARRLAAEREELDRLRAEAAERERQAAAARAEQEAKDRAERERVEAEQRAEREAEQRKLDERRREFERQQAELAAQQRALREANEKLARKQREREEAEALARQAEADHAEALIENARIDAELAEADRIKVEREAAEAEAARLAAPAPAPVYEIVEMVSVPKREYERLLERDEWLSCLEAAGVDNWSGFDDAREIMREQTA